MMSNSNTAYRVTTSKAHSHCILWPAQFRLKLVLGTRRKWPRRWQTIFLETRPRQDVGTSRDWDVKTETTALPGAFEKCL